MINPGDIFLPEAVDMNDVLIPHEMFDMVMLSSDKTNDSPSSNRSENNNPDSAGPPLQISKDIQLKRNRLAQKKFRDRQKAKMEQLQQQLSQQKDVISQLSAENEVLKNSIVCLQNKQQDTETVSEESDLVVAQKRDMFESTAAATTTAIATAGLSERSKSNDLFEAHNNMLTKSKAGCFLRKCWSRFAEEIRGLLAEYDASQGEEARVRAMKNLKTHMDSGIQLYMKDVLSQRQLLQHCNATSYESVGGSATATELKWLLVVQGMGLQKLQMDQIIALSDAFMPQIESKSSNQRSRSKDLQCFIAKLHSVPPSCISADDLDRLHDKALDLKTILREKQECVFEFLASLFQTVLEPVQMARCIAQSYPDYPDVCRMAHAVSETRSQLCKLGES